MAEDFTNVRLSIKATEVADRLFDTGFFEDRVTIVKLGFAYAVAQYYGKFSPVEVDAQEDSGGINYNVGSLDNDKSMAELARILYPEQQSTPYRTIRGLVCYGLEKLGERNDRGELFPIYEIM